MRFIKNPAICSRCTQLVPRAGSVRSSVLTDERVVVFNRYCLDCQHQMLIGRSASGHNAVKNLWPERQEAAQ